MREHKLLMVAVVAAMIALLASGIAVGYYIAKPVAPQGNNEGLRVEGVATITLIGSDGQTVGVWTAHNTLLPGGIDLIAGCLSGLDESTSCPGSYTLGSIPSDTSDLVVAIGSCASVDDECGQSTASPATNTLTPSGCFDCTGWVASASFSPSDLDCASSCALNDLAAWTVVCPTSQAPLCSLYSQFDDISGASLPSITITSGETLAVSIQFTVS